MHTKYSILAALYLCLVANVYAWENGGCKLQIKAEDSGLQSSNGKPRGPAIISGDAVSVGAFRLRFVDAKTGQALKPTKVTVAYGWKWLEYPYPEHLWGAWSDASDVVTCVGTEGEVVSVPQFEVKPRGWYNGKYAKFPFAKKPSFTGIDVTATLEQCSPRVTIKPEDARKLQGRTAVVKVDCHGESTVTYEKRVAQSFILPCGMKLCATSAQARKRRAATAFRFPN